MTFKLAHVGINCSNVLEAEKVAKRLSDIFSFSQDEGAASFWAGNEIEVMKEPYLGVNGHIAISTTDILQAVKSLNQTGVTFITNSAKFRNGKMTAIYLEEEIGGFAIHLVENK